MAVAKVTNVALARPRVMVMITHFKRSPDMLVRSGQVSTLI